MKHSSKNKLLGAGILIGLLVVYFLLQQFRPKINQTQTSPETATTAPGSVPSASGTPGPDTHANVSPATPSKPGEAQVGSTESKQTAEEIKPTTEGKSTLPSSRTTMGLAPSSPVGGIPTSGPIGPLGGPTASGIRAPQSDSTTSKLEASPQPKIEKVVSAPVDGCFNLTFVHKKIASHEDGEACLLHKNLIVLSHPDQNKKSKIDPKSICIRINGKAVKYSTVPEKPDQVVLGPEAGPNAKITASYCTGKAKCQQSCVIEKDQFLSAIGADEESDHNQPVGWDGKKGKSQEDMEVENQMNALNTDLSATGGDHSQLFNGWILEAQTAKCEPTHSTKTIAQVKAQ